MRRGVIIVKSFVLLVIIHVASMVVLGNDIYERCNQTPHPGQCKTLLIQHPTPKPITSTTEFLKLYVEGTLDGAVKAKSDTYSLGSQFSSKKAWEDCIDLYDQTIRRLNQSLSCPKNVCLRSDVQTWLSSALTNLDTCREGMSELGVSCDNLQSVLQSITLDVINALAINKGMMRNENEFGVLNIVPMEFPSNTGVQVDVVVAQDGSGKYKTIQEAIDGAGKRSNRSNRYVIRVKQGVYKEYVKVGGKSNNLMIIGDGIGKTIITGNRSKDTEFSTYTSGTFVADGDGLVMKYLTIRNTAGPEKHQAVALRSDSDKSAFYRCSFEGYQDTLYVHSASQFFKECDIYGTVDFIFGNAAVVFQDCRIFARRPLNGVNTITAHSRMELNVTTGIVIQNSMIEEDPKERLEGVKTYLGRPWRPHSTTVIMGTHLGSLIEPKGWMAWNNTTDFSKMYYGEYNNTGPGSSTENRVDWAGFHVISDIMEACKFTLPKFIEAASWLRQTTVPFFVGL